MTQLTATEENKPLDVASRCATVAAAILGRTWSFKRLGPEAFDPFRCRGSLFCFWHAYILPVAYFHRNSGIISMISGSRDGQRIAAIMQRWGIGAVRGSSTRQGAAAIRASVRSLQQGQNIIITPDGPRGPAEQTKPGTAQIALMANVPVVPIRVVINRAWRLRSWDRFVIPQPWARIELHYSQPIGPCRDDGSPLSVEDLTARIQKAFNP
jgi:lysophospholipid acyltransferase (LPLAT)-like uncharacterized protein